MKRIIGMAIGGLYVALAALAFNSSIQNWSVGNADLGFWWAVIGGLLGIACLGAFLGTLFHTRPAED